ncbi:MAG: ABC transporter permease subunit [Acidobacteria bacterium]|nr:ABC transporter permease subunit [Acidobacteriota bacterium]
MSGFLSVVRHTLSEALHRKLLLAMLAMIVLDLILTAALIGSASGFITLGGSLIKASGGGEGTIRSIYGGLAGVFYYPGLLLMCWVTASFFPRMQERGTIDLLLSKPIGRVALFAGRYAGCAVLALLVAAVFFGGNFLVLGWKTGFWEPRFLLTIPATVSAYLAFLSMMAVISLASRATVLGALMVTLYVIMVGPLLYSAQTWIGETLMGDSIWASLFAVLYNVLPRTAETGYTLFQTIRHGTLEDTAALFQVAVSALAWFALGAWWFRRKDY